ncbi:bifunctional nuclease family protein [bacterium]|nr:bifunctional nuclease family protein [bacterium]
MLREMDVYRLTVIPDDPREPQQLVLRERAAPRRCLPILIGLFEATAIEMRLNRTEALRPQTHDLLVNALEAVGGEVCQVEIYKLQDETFFAWLVVKANGREVRVDARPSDCVAIATLKNIPILVEEQVLGDASHASS